MNEEVNKLTENESKEASPEIKSETLFKMDVTRNLTDLMADAVDKSLRSKAIKNGTLDVIYPNAAKFTAPHNWSSRINGIECKYEDIREQVRTSKLIPELILLEKLGLGNITLSLDATATVTSSEYSSKGALIANYSISLPIEFKFTYKDIVSAPIIIKMGFNGKANNAPSARGWAGTASFADCTTAMMKSFWEQKLFQPIVYPPNIDALCADVTKKLETEVVRRRTQATQNVFRAETHERFKRAKTKIDAILRLMKSYAAIVGLRQEEIAKIHALPDGKKLQAHFSDYLRETTIATHLPATHLREDFTATKNAIVSKFNAFDPEYFKSNFTNTLQLLGINLQVLGNMAAELPASVARAASTEEKHPDPSFSKPPKIIRVYEQQKSLFTQLAYVAEQLPVTNFTNNPSYQETIKQIKIGQTLLQELESLSQTAVTEKLLKPLSKLNGCIQEMNRSLSLIRHNNLPANPGTLDIAARLSRLAERIRKLRNATATAQYGLFSQQTDRIAIHSGVTHTVSNTFK